MTTNVQTPTVADEAVELLSEIGVPRKLFAEGALEVRTPISGEVIGRVNASDAAAMERPRAVTTGR